MLLPELLALYLAWCADHRAAATVRAYRGRLKSFAARYAERELRSVTPLEVEAWLRDAGRFPDGRPKAADTRRLNAAAFEAFQTWAIGRRELPGPILAKIEKPPSRQRERIPTAAETRRLLAKASPEFRRIYQALRLSGARPNELCRATWADYDPAAGVIELREHKTGRKTGRPRRIAVGKQLAELIGDPPAAASDPQPSTLDPRPLFLSPTGTAWTPQRLSSIYRALRDRAGLARELVLYCARHEAITAVANARGIHVASKFAGHSSIKTTMRYSHTSTDELRAAQDVIRIEPPPASDQPPAGDQRSAISDQPGDPPPPPPDISREKNSGDEQPPAKAA